MSHSFTYRLQATAIALGVALALGSAGAARGASLSDPFSTLNDLRTPEALRMMGGCPTPEAVKALSTATLQPLEVVRAVVCADPKTRASLEAARARAATVGRAIGTYFPDLSLALQAADTKQDYNSTLGTKLDETTEGYALRLGWTLIDLGRRSAQLGQAEALRDAASAEHARVVQTTLMSAVETLLGALEASEATVVYRENEKRATEHLNLIKARKAKGAAGRSDLRQAEKALSVARTQRLRAESSARSQKAGLALRMGLPASTDLQLPKAETLRIPSPQLPKTLDELLEQTSQHPRILAAQAELRAAEQGLKFQQAEHLPSLALSGQILRNPAPSQNTITPDEVQTLALTLTVPIFQGFQQSYRVRQSEAEARRQAALLDGVQMELRTEAMAALESWVLEQRVFAESLEEVKRQQDAVAQIRARVKAGASLVSDLLEVQNLAAEAQLAAVKAQSEMLRAGLRYAEVLGQIGPWLIETAGVQSVPLSR